MGYPERLIKLIDTEARIIIDLMSNEDGHFDPEVINF